MTTRLASMLAAVATSLVLVAGCATATENEDSASEGANDENVAANVETGEAKTDSVGVWCTCPAGQDMSSDGLCYPSCKAGYTANGPLCWQNCAAGFTDTGAFCQRNAKIISADNSSCKWYDKCGLTLDRGCSTCPAGYSNDGCTCRVDAYIYAKPVYGRGVGKADETCSTTNAPGGRR